MSAAPQSDSDEPLTVGARVERILHAVSALPDAEWFDALVCSVAAHTDTDFALIGNFDVESGKVVTVSACAQGEAQGEVVYDLAGTPCERVVGRDPCRFPADVANAFPKDRLLREMGVESYVGVPLIASDGRALGVLCVLGVEVLADDDPSEAVLLTLADVVSTRLEQRELRRALADAQREAEAAHAARSLILANVSHEIRTPLNGIAGAAELLSKMPLGTEAHALVDVAMRSSAMLSAQVASLLDFSRIENGTVELRPQRARFGDLFADLHDVFCLAAAERGLGLEVDIDADSVNRLVGVDAPRLRQTLFVLMSNALKFTESGGVQVHARVRRDAKAGPDRVPVEIRVHDTGIGVAPERRAQVFEAFYQVDQSSTRKHGGVGLGLAAARRIVVAMGGVIRCEDGRGGRGSTFVVELELENAEAWPDPGDGVTDTQLILDIEQINMVRGVDQGGQHAAASVSDAVAIESVGGDHDSGERPPTRVLLVEDNDINRRIASTMLERLGCSVDTARDGSEAVDLGRTAVFDLILMDCQMPVLDGLEATRQLRGAGIETPIVALTAHATLDDEVRCRAAGMNDFLVKPVRLEQLRDIVGGEQ